MDNSHPESCRVCHGTGYRDGPPIAVRLNGSAFEDTTVVPCDHEWWWDDASPDEPISFEQYRAKLLRRAAAGDQSARAELSLWSRNRPTSRSLS